MTAVAESLVGVHPARLKVEGLQVQFGGVHALNGVTFEAEPGSIVGLIGANGSGKTTTLDVISGLVAPQSGSVRLDDTDLAEYLPEERLSVGMVRSFQDCRLFPELTVLDVLLLSEDARKEVAVLSTTLRLPWARRTERRKLEAVNQIIAAFGLERFRHHRTAELSTGTRRVVDLASIVLAKPRLLLLDEPTAGIAQTGGRSIHSAPRSGSTRWPTPPSFSSSTTCPWSSLSAPPSWSWNSGAWWPPGHRK